MQLSSIYVGLSCTHYFLFVTHHYLYEFQTRLHLEREAKLTPKQIEALESHLQAMWEARPAAERAGNEKKLSSKQGFLKFYRNGEIKACNYVGVIRCGEVTFHLLPKVFAPLEATSYPPTEAHLQLIQANLYWWLSFMPRLHFPRNLSSFEDVPTDFFEVLILLFAQHTHDLLSRSYYQHYQEVAEETGFLRGRLNLSAYTTNYATGRAHHLPCTFDSFQPDNRFNRILKHVVHRLLHQTGHSLSRRLLHEIHLLLDEVADQPASVTDCDAVHLSPIFADYQVTLAYCRLFLDGASPVSTDSTDQDIYALLFPSERLFEGFLEGFIKEHLAEKFTIRSQTKDLYLARVVRPGASSDGRQFQLRHDLLLEPICLAPANLPIILDAKYKELKVASDGHVKWKSVDQSDMYQMVSYALRRGSRHAVLLYPDSYSTPANSPDVNCIDYHVDQTLNRTSIHLAACRLPVLCLSVAELGFEEAFSRQQQTLIARLHTLFP